MYLVGRELESAECRISRRLRKPGDCDNEDHRQSLGSLCGTLRGGARRHLFRWICL